MKKGFLMLLMSLLLFVCAFVSVDSVEAVKIYVSSAEGLPGDELSVTIRIDGNPGLILMGFELDYDTSRLSFVDFKELGSMTGWVVYDRFVWGADKLSNNAYNGDLLELKFKILDNASTGDAAITAVFGNRLTGAYDPNVEGFTVTYTPEVTAGKITVKSNTPAPVIPPDDDPQSQISFYRFDMQPILPRTGFSAVRPEALEAMPMNLKYKPVDFLIEIPSINVSAKMVMVPFDNGEYQVRWLGDTVGLLEGFAMPGKGTTVLAAHNHLDNTEIGPFALLNSMEEGDRIFVSNMHNGMQIFIVYANEKIAESNVEAVDAIASEFENSLIMITCEDEMETGGYANRRIVAARPFNN